MTGQENGNHFKPLVNLSISLIYICPTSLILVAQVPGPGSAASHPREGYEPRLATALLAVIPDLRAGVVIIILLLLLIIPDLGVGVGAGPHGAGAGGSADAGEGDQGRVLRPASLIRVDIRALRTIF